MSFCEDEICHDKHIPFGDMLGIKVKAKPKIIIANGIDIRFIKNTNFNLALTFFKYIEYNV